MRSLETIGYMGKCQCTQCASYSIPASYVVMSNLSDHLSHASTVLSVLHTYLIKSSQKCSGEEIMIISTLAIRKLRGYEICPRYMVVKWEKQVTNSRLANSQVLLSLPSALPYLLLPSPTSQYRYLMQCIYSREKSIIHLGRQPTPRFDSYQYVANLVSSVSFFHDLAPIFLFQIILK